MDETGKKFDEHYQEEMNEYRRARKAELLRSERLAALHVCEVCGSPGDGVIWTGGYNTQLCLRCKNIVHKHFVRSDPWRKYIRCQARKMLLVGRDDIDTHLDSLVEEDIAAGQELFEVAATIISEMKADPELTA